MAPETINERVAILEEQSKQCSEIGADYRVFKESMIEHIATLKGELVNVNWKVGSIMGGVVLIGHLLIQWSFGKFFH